MAQVQLESVQLHLAIETAHNLGAKWGPRCKGDGFSPLIIHRCVLGVTTTKPISVLSLIPFKSQMHLDEGALLFRWRRQSPTDVATFSHGGVRGGSVRADRLR